MTSPDGSSWTARSSPFDSKPGAHQGQDVACAGGVSVAVGVWIFPSLSATPLTAVRSVDGISWSAVTAVDFSSGSVSAISTDGGTTFIIAGTVDSTSSTSPTMLVSVDAGATWSALSADPFLGGNCSAVAWNAYSSTWYACGEASGATHYSIVKSTDLITWTPITTGLFPTVTSFAFMGSATWLVSYRERAASYNAFLSTTDDGMIWASVSAPTVGNWVAYNGSVLVGAGFSVGGLYPLVASSDGGSTWLGISGMPFPTGHRVRWAGSQFLAVSEPYGSGPLMSTSTIATSPDGSTWTARPNLLDCNTNISSDCGGADFDGTAIIAVGRAGLSVLGYIQPPAIAIERSTDGGATWSDITPTTSTLAATTGVHLVASGGGVALAAHPRGYVTDSVLIRSTDHGVTWSKVNWFPGIIQALAWSGLEFGASVVPTTGVSTNEFYTSPDGLTWTHRGTMPESDSGITDQIAIGFQSVVWYAGFFDLTSSSDDGVTWSTPSNSFDYAVIEAVP